MLLFLGISKQRVEEMVGLLVVLEPLEVQVAAQVITLALEVKPRQDRVMLAEIISLLIVIVAAAAVQAL
jgi:hypothetical protein